jgi:hypothetical protein
MKNARIAKRRLEYGTGVEIPVYKGEFEIAHSNCAVVGTAKHLSRELELEILNRKPEHPYYWVRFFIEDSLSELEIQHILKPWFDSSILKKARAWCNGASIFEILINDLVLNSLQPIVRLPFGEIMRYEASSDSEHAVVLSPSSERLSGKELLFEIEEKLKEEAKEAELISYKRLTEDETLIAYKALGECPGQWYDHEWERIVETARMNGYFEVPKRITIEELADSLGMNSAALHVKLKSINLQVLDRLLKELRFPIKR